MANLLRIIQHMKPSNPSNNKSQNSNVKQDSLSLKFPGLAIPNEHKKLQPIKEEKDEDIVDDAMAALEALAPSGSKTTTNSKKVESPVVDVNKEKKDRDKDRRKNRSKDRKRDRSTSRNRRDRKHRSRSRERSRSRGRNRDRRRHRSRDRKRSRSREESSRSKPRRSRSRDRTDSKRSKRHESERSRSRSVEELSVDPEVGKIYTGKVANIVQFGCFVQLEGLKRRWEGLVHISQLRREGRVASAGDVVSRGQKVLVKVLSVAAQKVVIIFLHFQLDSNFFLTNRLRRFP